MWPNVAAPTPSMASPAPACGARAGQRRGDCLAHVQTALLDGHGITQAQLIQDSSPDGEHYIDPKFLSEILSARAFPDYDTYINLDALLELGALMRLVLRRLDYV